MDHSEIESLRDRHPAWRLLRATNAPLILGFLGRYFVEENHGRTPVSELAAALDDDLYALNTPEVRYPSAPSAYLADWAQFDAGWLHASYPDGSDELHYDASASFEKAYQWVLGLQQRTFVGTESRLKTLIELLRQIVRGAQSDPEVRLADLRRRRAELDAEIAEVEAGHVTMLPTTALRERYQQFSGSARELLSDFREVEENFRALDRAARERIATWAGSKGELLEELLGERNAITSSDQGRSFEAFYDFLLSGSRQQELSDLLAEVQAMSEIDTDRRLGRIHHDWFGAAERANVTVRQISEQLRRFLDDQVWLENKRVVELIRSIETAAVAVRDSPPIAGLELDEIGLSALLPFERPLYDVKPPAQVDSLIPPADVAEIDLSAVLDQHVVDQARLAEHIRALVPPRGEALLSDIVEYYPVEEGVAEVVGYLALGDDDLEIRLDDSGETVLEIGDADGSARRVRLPKATVVRR